MDDKFTPQSAKDAVLLHLERILDIFQRSCRGNEGWIEQIEDYRARLHSSDIAVQKQAIVSLGGRCHHQALGDANTVDYERYQQEVYELSLSCKRFLRVYDKQAA